MSLMPTGTPCSGPTGAMRSHARACSSARHGSTCDHAATTGSRASIRARHAPTSASELSSPLAIRAAASMAVRVVGSLGTGSFSVCGRSSSVVGLASWDARVKGAGIGRGAAGSAARRHPGSSSSSIRIACIAAVARLRTGDSARSLASTPILGQHSGEAMPLPAPVGASPAGFDSAGTIGAEGAPVGIGVRRYPDEGC